MRFTPQCFRSSLYWLVAAATVSVGLTAPCPGQSVVDPGATVGGRTIAEWTGEWWNWTNSMPASQNPILDTTGEFAHVNQTADVFFIAGNTGGSSTRSFAVPAETPLLIPLVNVSYTRSPEPLDEDGTPIWASGKPQVGDPAPAPADFVQDAVYGLVDEAVDLPALHLTLNGQSAVDLGIDLTMHRQQSGPFTAVIADAEAWSGEPVGSWTESVSDGYWVMIDGLPEGDHTLSFGGTVKPGYFGPDAFVVDVTANIRAVPEPSTALACCLAFAGAAILQRSRSRRAVSTRCPLVQ